jgi:translation initiation factor 2 alpha subunit (eIF-2alpha)
VTAVSQSGQLEVALDGFPGLIGMIGSLDQGWPRPARGEMRPGDRIAAGVIAVDAGEGRVRLSVAAARNRELWTFLSGLRPG